MRDSLRAIESAIDRSAWSEALELLDRLDANDEVPEWPQILELRAQAHYGGGEFEAAVEAWERLHAYELDRGDRVAAARAAAMVAMYLMMDTGMMAPVRGWLRTAERLLEGTTETPAHALIAMTRCYERFMCGDMDAARETSQLAIELGTKTGVAPAVVIGRTNAARVRIFDGDVRGGLDELEEIGALLMAGGADPLTTGMMYCELICAAQGLVLYDMASEWTDVMDHWRHGAAFGGISGRCRVHRAELLRISGPSDAAEAEALGACEELRPWMRREYGWPLVELGTIRLRRGDLRGAEEALLEAHRHAWSPQPGLALLRLAQGDTDAAAAMIAEAIEHPFDMPSKERPPFGDLRLAPLLDAQAEIAFARGDADVARTAATRLARIAEEYPGPFLQSWAALAGARAHVCEGDAPAAVALGREAVAVWIEIGAPYEAAAARLVLGRAHEAAGNADAARLEWSAAERAFRDFGATGRAAESAALLAASAGTTPRVAPVRPAGAEVRFVTDGINRTIEFQGRTSTIRDLKGLRYVARLAADPGREFHVLDLVAVEEGVLRADPGHRPDDLATSHGAAGLPVIDDVAREAYRRRLAEIDVEIDDAREMHDVSRLELAERDRDYLIAELAGAIGLGGRTRTVGGSSERARTSVTRTIRYALDQLATMQPELAERLRSSIRTGTYCSFRPDPVTPLVWTFSAAESD